MDRERDDRDLAAGTPEVLGYEIERELGRGGMGTVYLARQLSLGGRRVALKVLPTPLARSPSLWARFLLEVQALARLHHPNVVAVHDVVEHRDVLAYAMDWIDGCTLAQAIAFRNGLPDRSDGAALWRFLGTAAPPAPSPTAFFVQVGLQVARALDEAHRLRLLHRDVKPSNILLRKDGTAVLSDFGIVRAEDSTLHTQTGDFLGTPAYAAPEQLAGRSDELDARCDVYALGATLYHALTGKPPFPGRRPHEVLRRIDEGFVEPIRRVDPRLPRDLQTIVAKAMEAERERRYASASALADDLERFLSQRPIVARPASRAYQFQKLVQRHRAAFALLFVLFAALSGFAIVMTLLRDQLAEQRQQIVAQNVEIRARGAAALAAGRRAEAEAERARVQARKAERIAEVVHGIFSAVNPLEGGHDVLVRDRLDAAVAGIAELRDEPEVVAAVRYTLGECYRSLGRHDAAQQLLRLALDAFRGLPGTEPRLRDTLLALGVCLQERGDLEAAGTMLREARDLSLRLFGEKSRELGRACNHLAVWHAAQGQHVEARALLEQALAIFEALPDAGRVESADLLNNLADVASSAADPSGATTLLRRALAASEAAFGADHLTTAYCRANLAGLLVEHGDGAEAEALAAAALAIFERRLGPEHERTGSTLCLLANVLCARGKLEEAEQRLDAGVAILRRHVAPAHPELARAQTVRGRIRLAKKDAAGAAEAFAAAATSLRAAAPGHPELAAVLSWLGDAQRARGDLLASRTCYLEALEIRRNASGLGPTHPLTAESLLALGLVSYQSESYEAAAAYLTESLAIQRETAAERDPTRMFTELGLARSLIELARLEEAERLLLPLHSRCGPAEAASAERAATSRALVALYEKWGKSEKADQYRPAKR